MDFYPEKQRVIVVDVGTVKIRVGYAGDEEPTVVEDMTDVYKQPIIRKGRLEPYKHVSTVLRRLEHSHGIPFTSSCVVAITSPALERRAILRNILDGSPSPLSLSTLESAVAVLASVGRSSGFVLDVGAEAATAVFVNGGEEVVSRSSSVGGDKITKHIWASMSTRADTLTRRTEMDILTSLTNEHRLAVEAGTASDSDLLGDTTIPNDRVRELIREVVVGEGGHGACVAQCVDEARRTYPAEDTTLAVVLVGTTARMDMYRDLVREDVASRLKVPDFGFVELGRDPAHEAWRGASLLATCPACTEVGLTQEDVRGSNGEHLMTALGW